MIQEEIDKSPRSSEDGEQPLAVTPEGKVVSEIDQAFDAMTTKEAAEAREAMQVADLGGKAAQEIQLAFEHKDKSSLSSRLDTIVRGFVAKATEQGADESAARAALREQLKAYHDTYQELGKKEKAAEIDAFARLIESASSVSTEAGKAFLKKLEGGAFGSLEAAINALDGIKNAAKGGEEEKLNAEFNVLYGKINEKFLTGAANEQKLDASDDDIDSALGALG